jgi:hypothetical protein
MAHFRSLVIGIVVLCFLAQPAESAQPSPAPESKSTVLGTRFDVRPEFEKPIADLVSGIRSTLKSERAKGKLICYLSIPLSTTGGGYRPVNVEVSDKLKTVLEDAYGADKFYVLAPGHLETELPPVGMVAPGGGEYMYMWTCVLAGEDGNGSDFDMVYYAGRSDFHRYFGITPPLLIAGLEAWMKARAKSDPDFKHAVMDDPTVKQAFTNYYTTKAGIAFSNGAHDEWNIFVKINRNRIATPNVGISGTIPCYFDGRPLTPLDMEREVAPGYEQGRRVSASAN